MSPKKIIGLSLILLSMIGTYLFAPWLLIKLWLSQPVPKDKKAFEKLIKNMSSQPEEKKNDFMFLIHTYKTEVKKMESGGKLATGIRNLLG